MTEGAATVAAEDGGGGAPAMAGPRGPGAESLARLEGALGEAVREPLDRVVGLGVRAGHRAERDEEGREVLDRRVRVGHSGRLLAEREQRVDIAGVERLAGPLVE